MVIVQCPLACQTDKESQSHSNHLHSESTSLSSQSSLPSVPSLTSQFYHNQQPSITHHHCISTLKGNSSYVFSLGLTGKFLYSGSSDNEIRVWTRDHSNQPNLCHENSTSNIVAVGKGAVKSLVVFGNRIFSAHQDHKIRVLQIDNYETNCEKYKRLATLPTLGDRILRYLPPKNHVQVRRHKKCTWVHHVDTISALALSRDGSLLYSVSWDRSFKIWRTSDFKCLESVGNAHDDAINAVALSNDGYIYTGSADKKIKVWRKIPGEKKHSLMATLEKHKSAVNALALSSDGSVLYSGACDRSIVVWEKDGNVVDGGGHMVVVGALRGHTKAILCLAVVADLVCSGSADKSVRIWRRGVEKSYSCLAVLEGHGGPVKCLTASVDSCNSTSPSSSSSSSSYLVYSGSLDCDIKPSITHHHCISTLKGNSSYVFSLGLTGKFLYSGSSDNEIRVWTRDHSNQPNLCHENSTSNIVAVGKGAVKSLVVFGNRIFSAHQDHKIRVLQIDNYETNCEKYKRLATLPTLGDRILRYLPPKNHVQVRRHKKCTWVHHVDTISALALSRDGSLLYSVSWDRSFKIWRTSDFKCLESVGNAHDDAINAVALSNDGYIYTGSADKKIKVWSKIPGEKKHSLMATLEKHKSAVNALALSSDGSVLYSGACDRSIVVWEKDGNVVDGGGHMVVVGALRGHTKAILCLAVVADLVCSGSADKSVRIWRRGVEKSYSCLAVLEGHGGPVKCLTASVDSCNSTSPSSSSSYLVYSGSLDCDIKVWQILIPFL
ncbi:hypothetical protein HHK36_015202 [Tetracentron sinense]|uniref:Uncharacterized protein n=1 Tax=Tetracentron sinense TaxID=13715 RepID=A0A834ZAI9_TETSI|nr:hypothetical protein HHK36_015202 [Tetracentron sinense]